MSDKSRDAFRTISEVADWLGVQPHVLRFWESKFSQVKPVKRAGGRRYYRPNDMLLIGGIRKLLHEDGMTIKGAQKVLREQGMAHVAAMSRPLGGDDAAADDADIIAEAPMSEDAMDAGFVTGEVVNFSAGDEMGAEGQIATNPADIEEPSKFEGETPLEEFHVNSGPETENTFEAGVETPVIPPSPSARATPAEEPAQSSLPFDLPADPPASEPVAPPPDAVVEDAVVETAEASEEPVSEPIPETAVAQVTAAEPETGATADQAGDAEDPATPDEPVASPLPSFMRATPDPVPEPEPEPEHPETASDATESSGEAPAPDAPKPQIVDAPDPDEAAFEVAPSALSKSFAASGLSATQRADLVPLVAELAALRDRMAATRTP